MFNIWRQIYKLYQRTIRSCYINFFPDDFHMIRVQNWFSFSYRNFNMRKKYFFFSLARDCLFITHTRTAQIHNTHHGFFELGKLNYCYRFQYWSILLRGTFILVKILLFEACLNRKWNSYDKEVCKTL